MKLTYTLSLKELPLLAEDLLKEFNNGVIILQGDLAAGKTTFVKEIAKHLSYDGDVTSPTFSLQQCYGKNLFHYDIYNHGLEHFLSLGMLEELDKDGLHFIEWGDDALINMLSDAGIEVLSIKISKISQEKREYTLCIH